MWGDAIHIGRYDLLEGEDAKLEGKARINRAMELSTDFLLSKAFSQSAPPSSERMVMDMGSSKGGLARRAVRMYGCRVRFWEKAFPRNGTCPPLSILYDSLPVTAIFSGRFSLFGVWIRSVYVISVASWYRRSTCFRSVETCVAQVVVC